MSFDKKAKLLTGLKFLNMISRPGFLSNGHTSASFNQRKAHSKHRTDEANQVTEISEDEDCYALNE